MTEKKLDVSIHYTMAVCGGILGIYAIYNRTSVFGSAQTANLIELVTDLIGGNVPEMLIRAGALAVYVGAIVLAVFLEKTVRFNLKYLAVVLELAVVAVLGFLPAQMNPIVALYPVFFITAFQWSIFKGAKGYVSSTIFSTNNLKQTVSAFTDYLLSGGEETEARKKKGEKAIFFGGTLLSFHLGVAAGYVASVAFGLQSVWLCIVPLSAGLIQLFLQDSLEAGVVAERKGA